MRALWAQLIPGALAVLLVSWSAHRLWGARAAWTAGLLVALSKPAIFYTGVLLPPTWTMFLSSLLLYLSVTMLSTRGCFVIGVAGSLLGLAQPTAFPLILFTAANAWRGATRARSTIVLAIGVAIPLGASLLYNGVGGGAWTPIAVNRGINLYIGNGPDANGAYVRPPGMREDRDLLGITAAETALRARGEWAGSAGLSETRADAYWTSEALRAIAMNPMRTLGLFLRKLGFVIARVEIPQVESMRFESRYSSLMRLPFPGMALLIALAATGVVLSWKDPRIRRIALALLAAGLTIALFFVTARFRLVLVPWLAMLAAACVAEISSASARRRALSLAVGGFALGTSLLAGQGMNAQVSDGQYLYRLGLAAERGKDAASAMDRYKEALAVDPTLAKAEVNLGTLLAREGRFDEARLHLERGVPLDSETAIGRVSLAQLDQIEGRKERALVLFREAHALDSELLSASEGVAYLGYELGSVDEARSIAVAIAQKAPIDSPALVRARTLASIVNARGSLADEGWKSIAALREADLLLVRGRTTEAIPRYEALLDDRVAGAAARLTLDQIRRSNP